MIGLGNRLNVFQDKLVDALTSDSTMDLTLPRQKSCAYFCILSAQDSTYAFLSSLPRYPLIYPDEDGHDTTGTRGIRLSDAQVDAIQDTLDTMRNDEKTNHDNNKGDAAL